MSSASPRPAVGGRSLVTAAAALVVWILVIAVGRIWGMQLEADGRNLVLYTPPVLGGYRAELPPHLWIGVVAGTAAVVLVPVFVRRLTWAALLPVMSLTSLAWAAGLAAVDGGSGLTRGLGWDTEYAPFVDAVARDPLGFLRGFVVDISSYSIQIRGHPPGFMLVLAALHGMGLQGPGWASALVLAVGASAVAAVLVVVREVAGEDAARRSAPFVSVAPAALWIATSLDAFIVGVAAWSIALVVLATRRSGVTATWLAVAGGALAAFSLQLSYGMVLMLVVATPLLWPWRADRQTQRAVVISAATTSAVLVAFVPAGFWWLAGFFATREEYEILDVDRPYHYFLVNNVSAWAMAAGPAIAVGLAWLRDRRLWLVVGGALGAGLFANLSGLSEGEVERIWLPFTIWLLVAGASLGWRPQEQRVWLAVQVMAALFITLRIETLW